jgi:Putative auto-transporter adhesin, head GIN domain
MNSPAPTAHRSHFLLLAACTLAFAATTWAPAASAEWLGSETFRGNGNIKTESRNLPHFSGVSLGLPAQVEVRIGNVESVSVETDENLMPLIETVVANGLLEIRAKKQINLKTRTLKIVVQAKQIDRLEVGGSGSIVGGPLRSPKLALEVAGAGSIDVKDAECESISVAIGGSGDLKVAGTTHRLNVEIGGSGDVQAGQLKAEDAQVSIAGSGDVTVWSRDTRKGSIAGAGEVNYYGDPKVSLSAPGSGSVKRLGPAPH